VLHTQFDFVEPNAKDEFDVQKLLITAEEISTVKEQIVSTWEKIHHHEFYTGCGKPDCEWCNFTKENKIYTSLIEEETLSDEEE
jgi:DNA helicase-2/ATP-dependent DNA helicase PcrA